MNNTAVSNRYSPRIFWLVTCGLLACACFLRLYQIDLRPFHNDEGVNYHFVEQMRTLGYYPYSHLNYHGPIYFYAIALSDWIFGSSEFAMRFPSVIFGILCMLLPLMLRKTESDRTVLLSMALIGFSCSQVFHSRYAIHEMLFVLAGGLLGLSCYLWFRLRSRTYLYLCGVGLGTLIGTKETFIITGFSVFFAFWALCLPGFVQGLIRCSRESLASLCSEPRTVFRGLYHQRQGLFLGFLIAFLIILIFFSGGFRWMGGLRELFLGVPQWLGRNESDTGHFKPFWYYAGILFSKDLFVSLDSLFGGFKSARLYAMGPSEAVLGLILLVPGAALILRPRMVWRKICTHEYSFVLFSFVWTLLSFLVYSFVSYKTPWLIVNITLPALMCLGAVLSKLLSVLRAKLAQGVLTLGVIAFLAGFTWYYNFTVPYGVTNAYSYVHTSPGMLELVNDIEHYRERNPNARILVGSTAYWPLPFYVREFKDSITYAAGTKDFDRYTQNNDILVLDKSVQVDRAGWVRKYYRLTDAQESYAYFKRKETEDLASTQAE